MSNGKPSFTSDRAAAIDDLAATPLAIGLAHIDRVQRLPFRHRDPFDRMLVAQAMEEGLTIVTRDRRVAAYGVPVLTA
jgi:PIN domain nuclease of toxin-antitoxin system